MRKGRIIRPLEGPYLAREFVPQKDSLKTTIGGGKSITSIARSPGEGPVGEKGKKRPGREETVLKISPVKGAHKDLRIIRRSNGRSLGSKWTEIGGRREGKEAMFSSRDKKMLQRKMERAPKERVNLG